jgi:hemerythrin-like domain-containing protein
MTSAASTFARYEHTEIKAELDVIGTAADAVGRLSAYEAARAVSRVGAWLATGLGPHAAWEEAVVYAALDRAPETTWAATLMRFEHHQIERLGAVLDADAELLRSGPVSHETACDIRAHLVGLEALLRAHIEKEEAVLLPYVDNLDGR